MTTHKDIQNCCTYPNGLEIREENGLLIAEWIETGDRIKEKIVNE